MTIKKIQIVIDCDPSLGMTDAVIYGYDHLNQGMIIGTLDIGPFDTGTDIGKWIGRQLAMAEVRPLR